MELEELKASWNALDKRLAESEIVNMRMVKELIAQKTKSAYNRIYGINLYNFVVNILILGVVFPFVFMHTPIMTSSFVVIETVMVLGLIPQIWKISLLSKFDLEGKRCGELRRLGLRYKKVCQEERVWTIAIVCLAMIAFYIMELGFNDKAGYQLGTRLLLPIGLSLLTFALGFFVAKWQLHRHAQQIREIESGLEDLKGFES